MATELVEITVELKVTTEDWKNSSRLMVPDDFILCLSHKGRQSLSFVALHIALQYRSK